MVAHHLGMVGFLATRKDYQLSKAHRKLRDTTEKDLNELHERDKGICYWCKLYVSRKRANREHVIPLSEGGTHSLANMALTHGLCNSIQNWAKQVCVDITGRERELFLLALKDQKAALAAIGNQKARTLHIQESERVLLIDALTMWLYSSPDDAPGTATILAKLR